jgi:uncharacterized membrane protein YcgQ (UPF0703/DUF1980 family)
MKLNEHTVADDIAMIERLVKQALRKTPDANISKALSFYIGKLKEKLKLNQPQAQPAMAESKKSKLAQIKSMVEKIEKASGKKVVFHEKEEVTKEDKLKEIKQLAEELQKVTGKKIVFEDKKAEAPKKETKKSAPKKK